MAQANLDRLGWFYIGFALTWTVALAGGMVFLYTHRHLPCLRIRRLPLLFLGVISLHIYGMISISMYVVGSMVSCASEFWLMSVYLPFGIAMFHASNSQFLHIASRQKQYAHMSTLKDHKPIDQDEAERLANNRWKRISGGVERADRIGRMMTFIGIALAVQLALLVFVFFGSKKFHPGYGLFDYTVQGTAMEVRASCSKGWEWWLSIVWQFFWAWIYAPYMLWKSRGIRDVHGWRVQTICCCIAGLPASPMWLTALYAPKMASVNRYFVPPCWFSLSIFFIEVITIAFPIFQVLKTQTLRQETLDAIASWEKRQQLYTDCLTAVPQMEAKSFGSDEYSSKTTKFSDRSAIDSKLSADSQKSDMYTMVALENALRTNPQPLLQFAALKDFSGENVSFLTHVADWRREWLAPKTSTLEHRRKQFIGAVRIYASFVSLDLSEFPINISSREINLLHDLFESAAKMLLRSRSLSSNDTATPFDSVPADSSSTTDLRLGINLDSLGRQNIKSVAQMTVVDCDDTFDHVAIPDAFDEMVFAAAEKEIKYLVLTNTWPKFVNMAIASNEAEQDNEQGSNPWVAKVLCSA
ncbi:hypothetical protein BDV95DRAFT_488517 [Massariosphaeria phaeospora]|uniref:RGS domain-containing protein n=1 Tax=Massariosphaeria phaeospora TaxID=100035 RepID=A0A7C8MDF5_9PLEO|nr:hypothetical protein BDV95DRAFT_488517 [Massariosphaeria phaeospora]